MHSRLHQHVIHETGIASSPGMDTLRQNFIKQARGHRLRTEDLQAIDAALTHHAVGSPMNVIYESQVTDTTGQLGGTRALHSIHYYFTPQTGVDKLAKEARLDPYKHTLYAAAKVVRMTAKLTQITVRNLPLALNNETLETQYLRHSGHLLDYDTPAMGRFMALAFLLTQACDKTDSNVPPDAVRNVALPLGDGMAMGRILPRSVDTRLTLIGMAGNRMVSVPQPHPDQPGHLFSFGSYDSRQRLSRAQEELYLKLQRDFIGDDACAALMRENMDLYMAGHMEIPPDHPHRDALESLRIDARSLLESPYWLEAMQPRLRQMLVASEPQ